jgi:type I restriction enzyme R subunit
MLGRATRLCPQIGKTHFEIYDPVGVYESLNPVNTMKPVVQSQSTSFDDLLDGLDKLETEDQLKNQIDLIIAKIQRKNRNLSEKAKTHFVDISEGMNPTQLIGKLAEMSIQDTRDYILKNTELWKILDEGGEIHRFTVVSEHADEVTEHKRGYGKGSSPQDYLDEFGEFVTGNLNTLVALNVVCTRPHELTRESLKRLRLELDRHHFTEQQLNTAWRELKNEDIAADIISYIRRYAIGSPLISSQQRIKDSVERLRRNHDFSKMQLDWLVKIEKTLLSEIVIDRDTFETGAFKTVGGLKRAEKIFDGKLDEYLIELNQYLYDDGGKTA